jgi:hypothetical protein
VVPLIMVAMRSRAAVVSALCALLLLGCGAERAGIPLITPDQSQAIPTDLRGSRYCEVIPIFWRGLQLQAEVYNTIGLNDCPEQRWMRLDGRQLAQRYGALQVKLNGPRYWLMNRIEVLAGNVPSQAVDIGGLQMRKRATIAINPLRLLRGERSFLPSRVKLSTIFLFRKGEVVYELINGKGEIYRMQSYARIVDPDLKEADLARLGTRLTLPAGWRFRSRRLAEDSPLRAEGLALVLQDELQNSYQKLPAGSS